MFYSLRPYQLTAIAKLRDKWREGHKRVLLVAPTGSGKTVIASAIIESAINKGSGILFLAHRKELIDQCSKKLDEIGIDHGIIKSDHWRRRPKLPVQVASIQTLVRRAKPDARLVIIDETHRASAPTYTDIISHYPDALILGLTATPWRSDGKGLKTIYSDLVVAESVINLIEQGYLVKPRVFAPNRPDLAQVKIIHGDYDPAALNTAMDKPKLVGDMVRHWVDHAVGMLSVLFATSVHHSQLCAEMFQQAGISAEHVDGTTPDKERTAILSRLSSGQTRIVCNVDIISEGYDLPALSCCILARPTKSSIKYLQMVGRIMRPYNGKSALVLDHAGCVHEHGFVDDPREYSLEDMTKTKKSSGDQCWICTNCGAANPLTITTCPECGFSIKQRERREGREPIRNVNGELVEYTNEGRKPIRQCIHCQGSIYNGASKNIARFGRFTFLAKCPKCHKTNFWPDKQAARYATESEQEQEAARLKAIAVKNGLKPGWIYFKLKELGFRDARQRISG